MPVKRKAKKRRPALKRRRVPASVKGKRRYTTSTTSSGTTLYEVCCDCKHKKYLGTLRSWRLARRIKRMLEAEG